MKVQLFRSSGTLLLSCKNRRAIPAALEASRFSKEREIRIPRISFRYLSTDRVVGEPIGAKPLKTWHTDERLSKDDGVTG